MEGNSYAGVKILWLCFLLGKIELFFFVCILRLL
jgi:hypothetical protein